MEQQNEPYDWEIDQLQLFGDEPEPEVERELSVRASKYGRIALAGVASLAISVGGWIAYDSLVSGSGHVQRFGPLIESETKTDNTQNVLTLNAHGEKRNAELKQLSQEEDLDVINLQEMRDEDAESLKYTFPRWHIYFVMGDKKTKGGYGNVLMARPEIKDVEGLAMAGNTTLDELKESLKGVVHDIAGGDTSFKETVDATQEDRSAIQGKIRINTTDGEHSIRYITGHIGGDPKVHENQLHLFEEWIVDTEELGVATVACLDTNTAVEEFREDMEAYDYTVVDSGQATTLSGKNIDYCIIKRSGVIETPEIEVLENHTDHYAVLVRVRGQ